MSSIDSPPSREKFLFMDCIFFILKGPFTSLRKGIELASWENFGATLFKLNFEEFKVKSYNEFSSPICLDPCRSLHYYEYVAKAVWLVPEPILSYRLAIVAISCMQYLHRWDSNTLPTRDHFFARWATKSKKLPWLWRRRMRFTSMGRRQRIWNLRLSRQDRQVFYSETEYFCREQRIFYTWTLDLLYHTLRKAMKSDQLTAALSKPFIPSLAPLLFPRRVKRVRKAAAAYLEKVSRRASYDENTS